MLSSLQAPLRVGRLRTKRLGMELSMTKQRLSSNETRFQWAEGATMPAYVLTKGMERGHVELLRKLLHSARYQIRATSEMLRKVGRLVI